MFDMSWGEIMVIGGVALIVIGPKDLPKALRTVGQMTTKVRRLASEFQSQFSEAMREAELEDVRKEMEGLNRSVATATSTAFNPLQTIRDEIKGAVEAKPVTATSAESYVPLDPPVSIDPPLPPPVEAPVVEEVGPVPQIEPVAPMAPVPPAHAPAPANDVPTGPGLEVPGEPVPLRKDGVA